MAETFCKMLWFMLCLARSHAARFVQNETAEKATPKDVHKHDVVNQITPKVWVQGDRCMVGPQDGPWHSGKLSYDGQECCSNKCEVCGGPTCAEAIPEFIGQKAAVVRTAARCCTGIIVSHTDYCGGLAAGGSWAGGGNDTYDIHENRRGIPPCIMPDFECKWGLKSYDGKECCPAECNVCGGSECNKKDGEKNLDPSVSWWHMGRYKTDSGIDSWADKCCTGRISHMCSVDGIAPCKLA